MAKDRTGTTDAGGDTNDLAAIDGTGAAVAQKHTAAAAEAGRQRVAKSGSNRRNARIRDWKGVLANEDRRTKAYVFLLLTLISASMTFMQFGFIGVGTPGNYVGYVLALLGPIAMAALLLGKGWGTLEGLLSGVVLFVHAQIQPLDLIEKYFVTPLNSIVLYSFAGFLLGFLFAVALRNNPQGLRRVIYFAIVCYVVTQFISFFFFINSLIDAVIYEAQSYMADGEISRHTILALMGIGSLNVQVIADFALMLFLTCVFDHVARRMLDERTHASALTIFRANLFAVAFSVFMVVQSGAFVAITLRCEAAANLKMEDELDFIGGQLKDRTDSFDQLLDLPEFESISDESMTKLLKQASSDRFFSGYDLTDGNIAVFLDDTIIQSNSPAYPIGATTEDVFGKDEANLPSVLSQSGEMRQRIYNTQPLSAIVEAAATESSAGLQLGYMRAVAVGDYIIIMELPSSIVFEERGATMLWATALALILFLVIYFLAARVLGKVMLDPIVRTNATLAKITAGNLDEMVTEAGSVEFALLSAGINTTVDSLNVLIHEAERRNEADLATAKRIQASALPRTFPPFPEIDAFDIFASMNAAKEVGGDFFDFFLIDDHTLGFLIADVSGKGIPGALFMMAAKTEIENYMSTGMPLAEAILSANRRLCANNDAGMFVTVWAATLDYQTGELIYVNAGHNFPLLRRGFNGEWEWLKKKCGLFLGTFESAKYRQESLRLMPGDELLLYTDGVNEAFNVNEEEYGNDRLEAFLANHKDLHPRTLVESLRADVASWATGAEQSDDITILSLEFGVAPETTGTMTVTATLEQLPTVMGFITAELDKRLCPASTQNRIEIALEELFVNICNYAYANEDEPGKVQISYTYGTNPSAITIELRDQGVPFDPFRRDDPAAPASIEEATIGGLGIYLVKQTMDDYAYLYDHGSNVVAFKKGW